MEIIPVSLVVCVSAATALGAVRPQETREAGPERAVEAAAGPEASGETLQSVLGRMRAREERIRTVVVAMEMELATGEEGEPLLFQVRQWREGTERLAVQVTFQSPMGVVRLTSIRNEEGIFLHRSAPFGPDKYLHVSPELAAELRRAGGDDLAGRGGDMLRFTGSRLLEDLEKDFVLSPAGARRHEGVDCLVFQGAAREAPAREAAEAGEEELPSLRPDAVELLVGREDLVVRCLEERRGKEVLRAVRVLEVALDEPVDPERFRLDVPLDARLVPVLEDPEWAPHVRGILEREKEKGEEEPERGSGAQR